MRRFGLRSRVDRKMVFGYHTGALDDDLCPVGTADLVATYLEVDWIERQDPHATEINERREKVRSAEMPKKAEEVAGWVIQDTVTDQHFTS